MKRFVLTIIVSLFVFIGVIVTCNIIADSASYKTSQVEVKKISGQWVSCKKGTNKKINYTGIAQNKHGWWRVKNGYVDFKANGIYQNDYGWWKTSDGKVTFDETGVFKNSYGWWRVEGSKVNFQANEIYRNNYGWWKTSGGKVTFDEYGVFKNSYGWWKVEGSKVNFNYSGLASNQNGTWRIKDGKVDFSYNGLLTSNRVTYNLTDGKVISSYPEYKSNILLLGDSVSSGYMITGEKIDDVGRSYSNIASQISGIQINNVSKAGQPISRRDGKSSILDYVENHDLMNYDIIIITGGINDYFQNVSIGTDRSVSPYTFKGSLNLLLYKLDSVADHRKLQGKLPTKLLFYEIEFDYSYGTNKIGNRISDYNNAIYDVISSHDNLNCKVLTFDSLNSKTYKSYTYDKLHPNKSGTQNLAIELIEDILNN